MKRTRQVLQSEIKNIALAVILAIVHAFNVHVLILPADFAPGGVDGITVMLQELTGISSGVFLFMINLPLLVVAWFVLHKRYVIYTVFHITLTSLLLRFLEAIDFYQLHLPDERFLIAVFSGAILGIRTAYMLRMGASAGGADVVAAYINRKKPHVNVENIITVICYITILLSAFVYGNILSVLLSLVQMFVFNIAAENVMKDTRHAIEFRINTKQPELLADKIIHELKHGATVSECRGIYTGEKRYVITTIINLRQIADMMEIIKHDESAFVSYSEAKGIRGNFRWRKEDEVK